MKIEVSYESKDFWRIYLNYYFDPNTIFYSFFSFFVFGILLAALFLGKQTDFLDFVNVILFAFQFTILFNLVMSYFSQRNAQRNNVGTHEYTVSKEKIEVIARDFRSEIGWNWIHRVRETGKYFFLQSKIGEQYILPKRFFNAEQLNDFRNLLREKLENEAYLKKI